MQKKKGSVHETEWQYSKSAYRFSLTIDRCRHQPLTVDRYLCIHEYHLKQSDSLICTKKMRKQPSIHFKQPSNRQEEIHCLGQVTETYGKRIKQLNGNPRDCLWIQSVRPAIIYGKTIIDTNQSIMYTNYSEAIQWRHRLTSGTLIISHGTFISLRASWAPW